ncbi:MAG: hypothetical protein M1823_000454 [Watsoniomyces obsoletus]|nr:MAG: hypothetical protein M1823_000454 [Watsoniomyces obsoletus]
MATILPSRPTMDAPGPVATSAVPSSHPYTCNACQVAFRSSELQRGHMHSDWHRYNLKRRVASLPPLSSEIFAEKVVNAQASSSAAAAKASFERSCEVCQRTYYSENAFQNHIGSQKHKARLVAVAAGKTVAGDPETGSLISSTFSLGEPIGTSAPPEQPDPIASAEFSEVVQAMKEASINEAEPVTRRPTRPHHSAENERPPHPISPETAKSTDPASKDEVAASSLICLFCNYKSPTMLLNADHMRKFHGMFVPEQTYLVDLAGLLGYLHEKVFEAHECLYCGSMKGTTSGVQTHMRDKGHCMIAFESEDQMIEIGQFYDFRSTYSDPEDDEMDEEGDINMERKNGGVGLGSQKDQGEAVADADGWETDSSASSLDSADLTAVPLDRRHQYRRLDKHPHHSNHDARPHHHKDGWHSHAHSHPHAAYYSDYELHLPSGRSVGHRSLARYYRQNLHNYPGPDEESSRRAIEDGSRSGEDEGRGRSSALARTSNRDLGMVGVSDAKRREVAALETRERKRENRERLRYQWGVDKKGNQQKHFRDPLLQ